MLYWLEHAWTLCSQLSRTPHQLLKVQLLSAAGWGTSLADGRGHMHAPAAGVLMASLQVVGCVQMMSCCRMVLWHTTSVPPEGIVYLLQ